MRNSDGKLVDLPPVPYLEEIKNNNVLQELITLFLRQKDASVIANCIKTAIQRNDEVMAKSLVLLPTDAVSRLIVLNEVDTIEWLKANGCEEIIARSLGRLDPAQKETFAQKLIEEKRLVLLPTLLQSSSAVSALLPIEPPAIAGNPGVERVPDVQKRPLPIRAPACQNCYQKLAEQVLEGRPDFSDNNIQRNLLIKLLEDYKANWFFRFHWFHTYTKLVTEVLELEMELSKGTSKMTVDDILGSLAFKIKTSFKSGQPATINPNGSLMQCLRFFDRKVGTNKNKDFLTTLGVQLAL